MHSPTSSPRRFLNVFLLAMLNLAIMASLRNLPLVSEYGFSCSFLYIVVAAVFLLPSALVSAELATGWIRTGGIYIWVREAFGSRWGFFAIWMQWVHNVTWFPAILSFVATTLAYIFNPELANNKFYLLGVVLGSFWSITLLNLLGLRVSSWFSVLGVILGTIIPGLFIILLGVAWYSQGNPLQIQFTWKHFFPEFKDIQDLAFLAGMFLAFGGLEVNAVHAREVKNPQKGYPRAILLAALLGLVTLSFGSLSIASVIPKEQISLVAGLMQTFQILLKKFGLEWVLPTLACFIIIGAIAEVNAWIIGPVRGLYATAKHGDLPPYFQRKNTKDIPYNLLYFQGIIVTLASLVILFMPSSSSAFWILSALSTMIYLSMYILMFLAAIKLRYTHPHIDRPYRIPYRHHGMWLAAGIGTLSSFFAFFLSCVPPSQLNVGSLWFYEGFLILGIFLMWAIPHILYSLKKPVWQSHYEELHREK